VTRLAPTERCLAIHRSSSFALRFSPQHRKIDALHAVYSSLLVLSYRAHFVVTHSCQYVKLGPGRRYGSWRCGVQCVRRSSQFFGPLSQPSSLNTRHRGLPSSSVHALNMPPQLKSCTTVTLLPTISMPMMPPVPSWVAPQRFPADR
jgi:hypothetical protein